MRVAALLALMLVLAGCLGPDEAPGDAPQTPNNTSQEEPNFEEFEDGPVQEDEGAEAPTKENETMEITSPAVDEGSPVPERFTCEGENVSPPLELEHVPEEAQTLALVVDDPDAPGDEPFIHWLLWNIPADANVVPEGYPPSGDATPFENASQGTNGFDEVGYGGPCPPEGDGRHTYRFHLYALDTRLDLKEGATVEELRQAMDGHKLTQDTMTADFMRR